MTTTEKPTRRLRVLLVRLSAIGDCLHAVPVAAALRRAHPDAFIGWAIQEPSATLLRGCPGVDRFHIYPRRTRGIAARFEAFSRFRRELRSCRYDAAIDVQGLTKSGLVAWLSGARQRVGFRGGPALGSRELNRLFLNHRFAVPPAVTHVVDRNLALVRSSGLADQDPIAEWRLPDYAQREALVFLERHGLRAGGYAVVSPGTIWRTKRWPEGYFAVAVRRLSRDRGLPVVVVWADEGERRSAETIVANAGTGLPVLLAPPTDLRDLATLLRHAALFLGCDSGPAHLAAALDVPCVSVFGPTDPSRNGPYGPRSASVRLDQRLECQPCWRRTCSRGDFACMERLDPDPVVEECLARLDAR
ncbi:MAG: glycosyltransferase family 9 protein [Acidobacteria bacterium]|nr:glycosyltransferase family 9 protein [Acidobacteriota bacterium]MCY3965508.1 glycosyltransferase family 9 protein [Acidobacteriota bacterium]